MFNKLNIGQDNFKCEVEMITNTSPGCALLITFQKLGKLCHPPDESIFKTAKLNPDKNRSDQYLPSKLNLAYKFLCTMYVSMVIIRAFM